MGPCGHCPFPYGCPSVQIQMYYEEKPLMRIICFGIKVSLFLSYFLTGARMHVGFDFGHVLNDAECIHTLSTHLLIYIQDGETNEGYAVRFCNMLTYVETN